MIPGVIGALFGLIRTGGGIAAELVEIDAVCTGVGEYAVQNYRNAVGFGSLTQFPKVLVGAQQRVYLPVIGGVVAVVLVGFEDRVQIDAGHAQIFQIVQLAADTVQIAAEVVVVPDVSVLVGLVVGEFSPFPHHAVRGHIVMHFAAAAKAVGEDLIHHAALEELGCLIVLVVDCQLEHFSLIQCAVAGIAPLDIVPHTVGGVGEIVVVYAGVLGNEICGVCDIAVFVFFHVHRQKTFLEAGAENHQHRRKVQRRFFRQANGELTALVSGNGTEVRLIRRIPAVVKITHTEMLLSL